MQDIIWACPNNLNLVSHNFLAIDSQTDVNKYFQSTTDKLWVCQDLTALVISND